MKTWADLQRAALYDPVLQQAVHLVEQGYLTREEALIAAVLTLSKMHQEQHERIVALIAGELR